MLEFTTADESNAHRIIMTSTYTEKQEGLVDAMLCSWSDVETYNDLYRNISKLTPKQEIDVAQNILYRRQDKKGA